MESNLPLAKRLGSFFHAIIPAVVVFAAIMFHALKMPFGEMYLTILLSAAYGKTAWHDFMQVRQGKNDSTKTS